MNSHLGESESNRAVTRLKVKIPKKKDEPGSQQSLLLSYLLRIVPGQSLTSENLDARIAEINNKIGLEKLCGCNLFELFNTSIFNSELHRSYTLLNCLIILCGLEQHVVFTGTYSFLNTLLGDSTESIEVCPEANTTVSLTNFKLLPLDKHWTSLQKVIKKVKSQIIFAAGGTQNSFLETLTVSKMAGVFHDYPIDQTVDEQAASGRIIQASDQSIRLEGDIDAISGPLHIQNAAAAFGTSVKVSVNFTRKVRLQNSTEIIQTEHGLKKAKDIMNIRIGEFTTCAGVINLYYVTPGMEFSDESIFPFHEYIKSMFVKIKNKLELNQMMACNFSANFEFDVSIAEVELFFNKMKEIAVKKRGHKNDFLYIELYGCKLGLSVNQISSPEKLLALLSKVIDFRHAPHLKIDLAIRICAVSNSPTILFPEQKFYRDMKVPREYYLFFNRNFGNANKSLISLSGRGILKCGSLVVHKINSYSTIEDSFEEIKKLSHTPKCSQNLLQNSVYGFCMSGRKASGPSFQYLYNLASNIATHSQQTFPYRIEVRISPIFIEDTIHSISSVLNQSHFLVFSSNRFIDAISTTVKNFALKAESFQVNPRLESICNSMVYETFLIQGYLKGSCNMHMLPRVYHEKVRELYYSKPSISTIPVLEWNLELLADKGPKIQAVRSMVLNGKFKKEKTKTALLDLFRIIAMDIEDAAELILVHYIHNMQAKLKISFMHSDILKSLSSAELSRELKETLISEQSIEMDEALASTFAGFPKEKWTKQSFRALMRCYIEEKNVSTDQLVTAIKNVMLKKRLDLLFNLTESEKAIKFKPKSLIVLRNESGSNATNVELEAANILAMKNEFKELIQRSRTGHVGYLDEELLRLFSAYNYYSKYFTEDIFHLISMSALFGFIGARTAGSLRSKYYGSISLEINANLLLQSITWCPLSLESNNVIANIMKFTKLLPEQTPPMFAQIYLSDRRLYMRHIQSGVSEPNVARSSQTVSNTNISSSIQQAANFGENTEAQLQQMASVSEVVANSTSSNTAIITNTFLLNQISAQNACIKMLVDQLETFKSLYSLQNTKIFELENEIRAGNERVAITQNLRPDSLANTSPHENVVLEPQASEVTRVAAVEAEAATNSISSEQRDLASIYTLLYTRFGVKTFSISTSRNYISSIKRSFDIDQWKVKVEELTEQRYLRVYKTSKNGTTTYVCNTTRN